MASVLALLDDKAAAKRVAPNVVLPIDRYLTEERSFATALSHGGALYLVTEGDGSGTRARAGQLLLVAVLEAPECAGIKVGDRRKPGWYAPVNTTPVTDISKLRRRLGLGRKRLADALEIPLELTAGMDRALRELLDAVDAPVLAEVEIAQPAPTVDPSAPPLARALAHLGTGHLGTGHLGSAIEALVEAWRASRAPVLADLVDRATRLTPEYNRPLFDKRVTMSDDAAAGAWKEAFATDPVTAMPQLLLNLAVGGGEYISKRAKLLGARPPDPRISARLVELIPSAPNWPSKGYWSPIFDIWLRARDVRTYDTLAELEIEHPKAARLAELVLDPVPPALPAADRDPVRAIERRLDELEEPLRTECALVDEIAAHPDDDGPCLVYADWLIERGRPLGEYISLACQQKHGALSAAQARRLAMLVEVPYLCGAFDDLPTSRLRHRDRGIDRDVSAYWSTTPRAWRTIAASPLVRAVEILRLVGVRQRASRAAALVDFVRAAPALRKIEDIGAAIGRQVAAKVDGFKLEGDDLVRR